MASQIAEQMEPKQGERNEVPGAWVDRSFYTGNGVLSEGYMLGLVSLGPRAVEIVSKSMQSSFLPPSTTSLDPS